MAWLKSLLLAASLLSSTVFSYALPEACSGTCVNSHDPAIIRRSSDGTYFRFSTGGKIAIHTAPSLTGPWTYRGPVLPNGSSITWVPGHQDLWAPDVQQVGNEYYLYYSVSSFGSKNSAIGYAVSSSMDAGTWQDRGLAGVSSTPDDGLHYNAIDANLIRVDSRYYLSWGSWWGGLHLKEMYNPPGWPSQSTATWLAYDPSDPAMEAPYIFKQGSYYYLFFSKGACCGYDQTRPAQGKEYRIAVCRSSSPTGPYVDKSGKSCTNGGGTIVLQSHNWVYGPGGQGVYQDPVHGPVLYYHYVDTRVGYADGQKRFGWNKINFSSGWPVV